MLREKWTLHMLQIFAEGAAGDGGGESGGEGTAAGETTADAGQDRLLALGVPKDKLPKARKTEKRMPPMPARADAATAPKEKQQTEAKENGEAKPPAADAQSEKPAPLDWDALVKNPDFNARLQYMIRQRLGEEKSAKEKLAALGPVLQKLTQERGIDLDTSDMMKLDTDNLQTLVQHDRKYIQERAAQLGLDEETTQQFVALEDFKAAKQKQEKDARQREAFYKHMNGLKEQATLLKDEFPDFDLDREMQDERFAYLVGPPVYMKVRDAYYAMHNSEIVQKQTAAAAQKSKEQLAAALQVNQQRPRENGAGGQPAAVPRFDYAALSRKEQEAFKEEIRRKAYLGEKIYPR